MLLRATVTALGGSVGLLEPSCVCTVICGEQTPAVTLIGEVVNTSLLAVNVTVAVCEMVTLSVVSLAV